MLTETEAKRVKEELKSCARPLFFFHDDPDGLASFLLCYRFIREGRGLPVKAYPRITIESARKIEEYGADKVFILDVAMVDQEFIDAAKVPVVWIDHHAPLERENVLYFNPQRRGVNVPTPALIWQAIKDERPEDLWIAVTGSIGDWYFPPFAKEYQEKNADLLPIECTTVQEALFNTTLGKLVKTFSFILKGHMTSVMQNIKALTRLEDPREILYQTTSRGGFLWRKYVAVNEDYEKLLEAAKKHVTSDKLFLFIYQDDKLSLTKDLANELLYLLKDKIIILGRERQGEMRCSLRAPENVLLSKALERALVGIQGYGGGHEQACGAAIKKEDFETFLGNFRREIGL
ncbi:MAG TPA: DHH family phosphoesterase [Candidatus Nanoarchaeia archaeon]|nr:DHH family phosphoesterase [Candidatus Nanoarchaeia archaeon]